MHKLWSYFLKTLCCSEKLSHKYLYREKRWSFFRNILVKTVESSNNLVSRSWDILNVIVTLSVQHPVTVPFSQIIRQFENFHLQHINNFTFLTWIFEYSIVEVPLPEHSKQGSLTHAGSFVNVPMLYLVVPHEGSLFFVKGRKLRSLII